MCWVGLGFGFVLVYVCVSLCVDLCQAIREVYKNLSTLIEFTILEYFRKEFRKLRIFIMIEMCRLGVGMLQGML